MAENVFRPVRRVNGKKVRSRLFCGRYTLTRGAKPVTVYLHTPDEKVARKMLRDIIVEKQRETVGLIAPKSQREALQTPLSELIADYAEYLRGRGVTPEYLRDTIKRLQRITVEAKWQFLGDVRPDSFLRWRAKLNS